MKLNQYEWNPENDKIGGGSFAEVFKAKDNNGDPVALKIYRSSVVQSGSEGSSIGRYSLENEFSKGKHLSHTNIIRYIGLDYLLYKNVMQKEEKFPVLIMEFADAGSLDDRLNGNANTDGGTVINFEVLDESEKISIAKQILAGIGYLHEQGIIHRDLKPGNILFKTDRMGRKVVKITDFGISRDSLSQDIGATAFGVGTVAYMAPEQFFQKTYGLNQTISERTDIWAFGIILYRLLTGTLPFSSQEQITDTEVNLAPVPVAYRAIVKGCLQKHAVKRYASAKDVIAELDKVKPVKPKPSFPVITVAIVACIAVLMGAGFFVYKRMHDAVTNDEMTIDNTLVSTVDTVTYKCGFLNQSLNKIIIPFKYDLALFFMDGIAPVELNNKWGAIDKNGNEVIPIKYEDYAIGDKVIFSDGLVGVKLNGKWGFINKAGSVAIPFKYDNVRAFSEGLAAVESNSKWGFINKDNKEITSIKYDSAGEKFSHGLYLVKLNNKRGFIDKTGKEIIPPKYDDNFSVGDFSDGLVMVSLNNKWGFIDSVGNRVLPTIYDDLSFFSEGLAMVKVNGNYGFIDTTGNVIIPAKYDIAKSFSEGLAAVELNNKWGFINKTGREVIPLEYDFIWSAFSEGLAEVELNGKYGFIDNKGKEIIPIKYAGAGFGFSEGLVKAELNDKWGFIDKIGKEIIPFKYDDVSDFSEGLTAVKLNGKYGYIDTTGNEVIPFKFERADKFEDGHASVEEKNSFGISSYFIDKNGNMANNFVIKSF